jgi:hypothetical protein
MAKEHGGVKQEKTVFLSAFRTLCHSSVSGQRGDRLARYFALIQIGRGQAEFNSRAANFRLERGYGALPYNGNMQRIFTIGHSTLPIEDFIARLKAHGIAQLVDIRTIPRSRHNPQFGSEALAAALEAEGIAYRHMKALGGLRKPRADSPNTGWRNTSFRGYADYMQTPEFQAALETLIRLSQQHPAAIMCAESVPWRCHRSLVADALTARGIPVEDIMPDGRLSAHRLKDFARVEQGHLTYPSPQAQLPL